MRGRRPSPSLLAALVAAAAWAGPATAQVTVNQGALDLLPARKAPTHHTPPRNTYHRPTHQAPHHNEPQHGTPHAATPAAPTAPVAPSPAQVLNPVVPLVPPAIAALPPPPPLPPVPKAPPPVVPVKADAAGIVEPVPGGIRITFGPDSQDLNPKTEAALQDVARQLQANPQASVNLYAYAAGSPEDPSTARRLSLERALATRAVLINRGVASTRIYPRALGNTPAATLGGADPNRVDVVTGAPGAAIPAPAAAPAPTPAAASK